MSNIIPSPYYRIVIKQTGQDITNFITKALDDKNELLAKEAQNI